MIHVEIQPLTDPGSLRSLAGEATAEGHRMVARLIEEWVAGTNRFNRPRERVYVVTRGQEVIGVCGLNVDPFAGSARVGRVRRLYISAMHRRQGVGTAVMGRLASTNCIFAPTTRALQRSTKQWALFAW